MLCVLFLRRRGLPMSWGDNPGSIPCSTYLTGWVTHDPFTAVLGRQPRERGAARLQSPFPIRVFSPSPPLSSFPIPLFWHTPVGYTLPQCYTEQCRTSLTTEIVGTIIASSFSTRVGRVMEKRAREKTVGRGENKHRQMRSLPSQRGCRSHTGRWVMRDPFG